MNPDEFIIKLKDQYKFDWDELVMIDLLRQLFKMNIFERPHGIHKSIQWPLSTFWWLSTHNRRFIDFISTFTLTNLKLTNYDIHYSYLSILPEYNYKHHFGIFRLYSIISYDC